MTRGGECDGSLGLGLRVISEAAEVSRFCQGRGRAAAGPRCLTAKRSMVDQEDPLAPPDSDVACQQVSRPGGCWLLAGRRPRYGQNALLHVGRGPRSSSGARWEAL